MSDEAKTKPTEEPRIEKLSNYITELLQSIKELGNDIPKDLLDAVEGAAKNIVIAKNENEQRIEELEKKKQAEAEKQRSDAEKKEISERDALGEKVREIFEAAMTAEIKISALFDIGDDPECASARKYIVEKRVIEGINERVLKNTPYILCKYFRKTANAITHPFKGFTPTEVDGEGIMLVRKDKVSEYENSWFDDEKMMDLAQKKLEDMTVQDCINVAKYTGAPRNTSSFIHLLDHLVRLGAWRVNACKKPKISKGLKVTKASIIKAYKDLVDRLNVDKSMMITTGMEIID